MQTRAKMCHKIPPTFAGRRVLSDTAGQWPISSKQVSHVAEKGIVLVLDPLTMETDLLHTWKVGLSFLLDARCPEAIATRFLSHGRLKGANIIG